STITHWPACWSAARPAPRWRRRRRSARSWTASAVATPSPPACCMACCAAGSLRARSASAWPLAASSTRSPATSTWCPRPRSRPWSAKAATTSAAEASRRAARVSHRALRGRRREESPRPGAAMLPAITAFSRSPDRGRGLASDLRVRWALEEIGQPYRVRLLDFDALGEPAHRAVQPFGQIPTYEEDGLALFESGAIVLYLAERHVGLLPHAPGPRARAIAWMFAALNTVEPPVFELSLATFLDRGKPWQAERRAFIEQQARRRLADLARYLGEGGWLEDGFSAGDLLMVSVLARAEACGLLEGFPTLAAYLEVAAHDRPTSAPSPPSARCSCRHR